MDESFPHKEVKGLGTLTNTTLMCGAQDGLNPNQSVSSLFNENYYYKGKEPSQIL
jgi:hypothetical protein